MQTIDNTQDLGLLCQRLAKHPYITVDLEFIREKTYFPLLCLIQVASEEETAIIDPLAEGIDLNPFFEVLQAPDVLKVFHSCRQDVEIFYNLSGKIPAPLFDTQIAAMVCGFGPSVGYENLVRAVTGIDLDKSSRLTDWGKRPLETRQLEYALRDVTFLIPCYQYLDKFMQEHGRCRWIDDEINALYNESLYKSDPENMWQKIRHSAHSPQFLAVLKELAAWRERRAMKHDIPRQTILKDEILVNIAACTPKSIDELAKVRNMRADVSRGKLGEEIVETVRAALKMPFSSELRKIDREKQVNIPANAAALVEILRLLLKIKSEQAGVVAQLIASEKDLRNIACGAGDKTNPALNGWRYDIFGRYALAFRKGKAAIRYNTAGKDIEILET